MIYFWTYGIQKAWLDKCLESPVSEEPSINNMVNGPKPCWNLSERNFAIFIDPCEGNSVWKCLPGFYAKSSDFLLTHWLPITTILLLTEAIFCDIFRCNYLRNEKVFLTFCLHFWNLDLILNIFKQKLTLIFDGSLNLWTPKNLVK